MNKLLIYIIAFLLVSPMLPLAIPISKASTTPDVYVDPPTVSVGRVGRLFDVSVKIGDATNIYGYEFKLSFNATLLQATAIYNGTFFGASPQYYLKQTYDNDLGIIWVALTLTGPQQGKNGSGLLATITFNATSGVTYPNTIGCTLDLYDVKLADSEANSITQFNVLDGQYTFIPLRGDLNGDGKVDIIDIVVVALAFGATPSDPNWNPIADVNQDLAVNILDAVIVAVQIGMIG